MTARSRVLAVVLTYQSPDNVRSSVKALRDQSSRLDIVIIDNHSDRAEEVRTAADGCEVVRLATNTGPAGGFFVGASFVLERGYDFAWLLDDDVSPEADCLELLLTAVDESDAVAAPSLVDELGRERNTWGWIGLLVPRRVLLRAGLPAQDLFWGEEDAEWLHYRVREQHGIPLIRVAKARATVIMGRSTAAKPRWKYYYEVRNLVNTFLYRRKGLRVAARLKILSVRLAHHVRQWSAEKSGRWSKLGAMLHGLFDGIIGRMGKTMNPTSSNRPGPPEVP